MPNQDYLETWNTYQAAWADIPASDRDELLGKSVADDCVYTDPEGIAHGKDALVEKIVGTQQSLPGASFHNDKSFDHGDEAIFAWTMSDADGKPIFDGASFAVFGADGRLSRMTGFFEPVGA